MDKIGRTNGINTKANTMATMEQFFCEMLGDETLSRIVFSGKRKKSLEYDKVTMRPVEIGGEAKFQAEFCYPKKVSHRNLDAEGAKALALLLVEEDFKQVNAFTGGGAFQALAARPETPRITRTVQQRAQVMRGTQVPGPAGPGACGAAPRCHNRAKNYVLPAGEPCDFLIRLGIMDRDGTVFARSYNKFRQINRYLEIVEDVFPCLPKDKTLKIIDFGCGKAYLTFALYHYLAVVKGRDVEIIGLDLKEDVIDFSSQVATDLGYARLKFLKGDIADYTDDHADMVVTLHACDTATDYALINAVAWNTKVILSVPCCQHELFRQIKNDLHSPMLKHGILKDRLTEYLTDGLRGLKLEAAGYDVAMIEFTSLEHTARNIMIKAVKSNAQGAYARKRCEAAQQQYEALCDFYQVRPCIDKLPACPPK